MKKIFVLCAVGFLMAGCATVAEKPNWATIESDPELGALMLDLNSIQQEAGNLDVRVARLLIQPTDKLLEEAKSEVAGSNVLQLRIDCKAKTIGVTEHVLYYKKMAEGEIMDSKIAQEPIVTWVAEEPNDLLILKYACEK